MQDKKKIAYFASFFAALIVVSNITASKLVSFYGLVVPVAVIAYPITFLITDVVSEVYGKRTAQMIVNAGFWAMIGATMLIFLTVYIPPAPFWKDQIEFQKVLGSVPRIVTASLVAYLISQNHDLFAFHFWKKVTRGRHLWLRNNASTMVSQLIDTAVFISIAFFGVVSNEILFHMIISQYIVKLLIALADTPFCYLLVRLTRMPRVQENDA